MFDLVYISSLIVKWGEELLLKNPHPKPTYAYYELDSTSPFYIEEKELQQLSKSFHVWLVKMVVEMHNRMGLSIFGNKLLGDTTSDDAINFMCNGFKFMLSEKSHFNPSNTDITFLRDYLPEFENKMYILKEKISHGIKCTR